MKYTVVWKPKAEEQLADIWIAAFDRVSVAAAADEIDRRLKMSPLTYGESRSGVTRIAVVPPLSVHFDVHDEDRLVAVLTVRYTSLT